MSTVLQCMFDTNVFNRILDGVIPLHALENRVAAHATHIQRDEISNTKDAGRRTALEKVFGDVVTSPVPTESLVLGISRIGAAKLGGDRVVPTKSAVWDVSAWDQASWDSGDNVYSALKTELDALNGTKKNNIHDALIAETSIKGRFVLIRLLADEAIDNGHPYLPGENY